METHISQGNRRDVMPSSTLHWKLESIIYLFSYFQSWGCQLFLGSLTILSFEWVGHQFFRMKT